MKRSAAALLLLLLFTGCVEVGVDTDKDFYALNKKTAVEITSTLTGYWYSSSGFVEIVIYKLPEWEIVDRVYGPEFIQIAVGENFITKSTWDASEQSEGLYLAAINWVHSDIQSWGDLGPFSCVDLFLLGPSHLSGDAKKALKAIEQSERMAAEAENIYRLLEYGVNKGLINSGDEVDLSKYGQGTKTVGWVFDVLSPYNGFIYSQKEEIVSAEYSFIVGDYENTFRSAKGIKDNLIFSKQILMETIEQQDIGKGEIKNILNL